VAKVGRNQLCPCGSGRKAKHCCGVERGPSKESLARAFLSHAASGAAVELRAVPEAELEGLFDKIRELPALDLSLQVELPKLVSPAVERLCEAMVDDDPGLAVAPFGELLHAVDTPLQRARLARAVIALRAQGALDARIAAAALIDLASGSCDLIGESLIEAVAVRMGSTRTPGGILLAA
jgi:hypothetical protein